MSVYDIHQSFHEFIIIVSYLNALEFIFLQLLPLICIAKLLAKLNEVYNYCCPIKIGI